MRASRLLSILTTLQAKGHVTAQALADECEVSIRTIYRDVDALSAAGIPVYSERGTGGGYRLLNGYRTRLNGLSAAEAEALLLAGLTHQTTQLGLGPAAATARTKLIAAMPEPLRAGATRVQSRFHLDAPSWFGEGENLTHLPQVAEAVWSDRVIRIRYRSWKGEKLRRVEPLGIVQKGGAWYLVGQIEGSVRTYRISRILDLAVLDEAFVRPDAFDLADFWARNTRRFDAELHPVRATLRLSPAGVDMMDTLLPAYSRSGVELGEADPTGWRLVTVPVGGIGWAPHELMRFGAEAEVIGPPELRARMAEVVASVARIYADDAAQDGTIKAR